MNLLMKVRLIFAIMLLLCQAACDRRPDIVNLNSQGETIICFGDSITEGYGVKPEESYSL